MGSCTGERWNPEVQRGPVGQHSRVLWACWDPTVSLLGQTGVLENIRGTILDSTGFHWGLLGGWEVVWESLLGVESTGQWHGRAVQVDGI